MYYFKYMHITIPPYFYNVLVHLIKCGICNMSHVSRRRQWGHRYLPFQPSFFTAAFVLICVVPRAAAWDNEDFELFDLVEEVQQNFYDVLGVDKVRIDNMHYQPMS